MKKCLLLLFTLIIFTGCTVSRIDNLNYKDKTDKILLLNIKTYNKVGKGYKYYAPRGVIRIDSNSYNDVLKRDSTYYYLYVDVVSYYHKTRINDKNSNNKLYYYKEIKNGKKQGYVKIIEKKNKLFVQMVYNYAKIESYVDKNNIDQAMEDISYILSSMKFNDSLLKKMYEAGNLNSKEEVYKLFDNKDKEGNFLEYIKEYDKYDGDDVVSKEGEIEIKTTTVKKTTADKSEIETTTQTSTEEETTNEN